MKSEGPLVSVVLTSYNHGKYIHKTIDSILGQDYSNLELIIIDDASKDNSRQIIEEYASKDKRIIALYHTTNKGIAKTANDGLAIARGDYICFQGSDDIWYKDKLSTELEIAAGKKDVIVWSEGDVIDAYDEKLGFKFVDDLHKAKDRKKNGHILSELLKGFFIFGQSIFIPADLMRGVRYDENFRYLNDYIFYLEVFSRGESLFIPKPTAAYRIHGKNSILNNKVQWARDTVKLVPYLFEHYYSEMDSYAKAYWSLQYLSNLRIVPREERTKRRGFMKLYRYMLTWSSIKIVLKRMVKRNISLE